MTDLWVDDTDPGQYRGDPNRLLWRMVIKQAVDDAAGGRLAPTERNIASVEYWLTTDDFRIVTELADVDTDAARSFFEKIIRKAKPHARVSSNHYQSPKLVSLIPITVRPVDDRTDSGG